ncbi:hypothetical protein JAAARDRAFT_80755 [Jaapia argillacea MUCL 33604]|uniref:Protein kinase domain-containing protein n=1 Tax=Jaapia argillacea MUCL 33604 TaxID=933084 RepID=A0A067PF12_9AGAM|nr:hypothetical protein JAAARDRAFT_80755 [Jaapia argillacea MUCL 33604]
MDSNCSLPQRPSVRASGQSRLLSSDFEVKSDNPHVRPTNLSSRVVNLEGPLRGGAWCDIYTGEIEMGNGRKEKVAMKQLRVFLNWTEKERSLAMKLFRREIKIWSSFNHPHILPFYGFATIDTSRFFLISPWATSGNNVETCLSKNIWWLMVVLATRSRKVGVRALTRSSTWMCNPYLEVVDLGVENVIEPRKTQQIEIWRIAKVKVVREAEKGCSREADCSTMQRSAVDEREGEQE